jgi:hypothetical protein
MPKIDWSRGRQHRTELYTLLALVIGALTLSHSLGYWPHGIPAIAPPQSSPATPNPTSGWDWLTQDLIWRIVSVVSFLTVGVLYYLGRRAGNNAAALPETHQTRIRVEVLRGVLAPHYDLSNSKYDVDIFLRLRLTVTSSPSVKLKDWKLQLLSGSTVYATGHRDQIRDPLPCLPSDLPGIEKKLDDITANEEMPLNVSTDGWLKYRTIDTTIDRVLQCDFSLTLIDSNGEALGTVVRPGPWLTNLHSVALTVLDVYLEPSEGFTYTRKLRLVLRNDTGEDLDMKKSLWVTEGGDAPIQQPLASSLQLEDGKDGWKIGKYGKWKTESDRLSVAPHQVFRTWVGLDPTMTEEEVRRRREIKQLGTLVSPMRAMGHDVEIRQKF